MFPTRPAPLALLAEHGFDDIGDRRQLKRFAQERGVHAARGFGDGAFGKSTHHHRGDFAVGRILLHGLQHGRPVHYRHHEIEQDQIG